MNRSIALLVLVSLVSACGGEGSAKSAAAPKSALPESFHLAAAPAGAKTVLEAKATAAGAAEIAVRGTASEFVEGMAAFTLVDASMKSCADMGEDHCETPWDYCCNDATELARGSALVDFREDGKILSTGARGFHGLDHLAQVVVVGKPTLDASGNLSIAATGVHVLP